MDIVTIVSIASAVFVIAMLSLTARKARTAPAPFLIAFIMGMGLTLVLIAARTNEVGHTRAIMLGAVLALVAAMLFNLIFAGKSMTPCKYEAHGSDMDAIHRSCAAFDEANETILAFNSNRRSMSFLQRLHDAFVTTEEERTHGSAVTTKIAARKHLDTIVPDWHRMRTEALVDQNKARAAVDVIETRLRPLETIEETARDVHQMATNAVAALDNAIEALQSAQNYETLDIASSNKGISAISTMANSAARDKVRDAKEAIDLLSHKAKTAIDQQLIAPGDTLDFILDMTLDNIFDFMSLFNIGKLIDARHQCEKVRERVTIIEAQLRTKYLAAREDAQAVRNEVAIVKQPYRETALQEIPEFARTFVPAIADEKPNASS